MIDERMRSIEKETLKGLGYELIEIKKNTKIYPEISSHVDIFACKVKNKIIAEKYTYDILKNKLKCLSKRYQLQCLHSWKQGNT